MDASNPAHTSAMDSLTDPPNPVHHITKALQSLVPTQPPPTIAGNDGTAFLQHDFGQPNMHQPGRPLQPTVFFNGDGLVTEYKPIMTNSNPFYVPTQT